MASFPTHISFGVALGAAAILTANVFGLAPSTDVGLFVCIAVAAIVGSILPDIDSDTGLPFTIAFGSLTIIAGGLSLLIALRIFPHDSWGVYAAPLIAMGVVWFIIGGLFKKWTTHRGMVHSIPAALAAGLILFFASTRAGYADWNAFLVSLSLTLGFLLHLVLDELNSVINFHGRPFVPNKALGSALKITSDHPAANAIVYSALFVALTMNYDKLSPLVLTLFQDVHN